MIKQCACEHYTNLKIKMNPRCPIHGDGLEATMTEHELFWEDVNAEASMENQPEHVCEWTWIYRTGGAGPRYIGCTQCKDAMNSDEQMRRLNATERLSAEDAEHIANVADGIYPPMRKKLQAYADTREVK